MCDLRRKWWHNLSIFFMYTFFRSYQTCGLYKALLALTESTKTNFLFLRRRSFENTRGQVVEFGDCAIRGRVVTTIDLEKSLYKFVELCDRYEVSLRYCADLNCRSISNNIPDSNIIDF